jgi:hypothetical protein
MHENRRYVELAETAARPPDDPQPYPQPVHKSGGNVDNLLCAKCADFARDGVASDVSGA